VIATLAVPFDGLAISHVPLDDTTSNSTRRTVTANVTSDAGVASVELVHRNAQDGNLYAEPMSPTGNPGEWGAEIAAQPFGSTVQYFVRVTDVLSRSESHPANAPTTLHEYDTLALEPLFTETFDSGAPGWTHGLVAGQDDWQVGPPNQSGTNANDPHSAFSGPNVYGNDLAPPGFNGDYAANVSNWLQSPSFSTAGRSNVRLRYRRWLTVEDGFYDTARIRVNGVEVWRNAIGSGSQHFIDSSWALHDLDVSGAAANRASNVVRFELESDAGVQFGGWNLDDFQVVSEGAQPVLTPSDATPLSTDVLAIDVSAPGFGGKKYLLVASESTAPGTPADANRVAPAIRDQRLRDSRRDAVKYFKLKGVLDGLGASTQPEIRLDATDSGDTFWVTGVVLQGSGPTLEILEIFAPVKIAVQ
jgi:hypothetical protein